MDVQAAVIPADVKELPSAYRIVMEVPGVGRSDVKLQLEDGNVLVVSGERRRPEGRYVRRERTMGKFARRFRLPHNADAEKIAAACADGVLTVEVGKVAAPPLQEARKVQVE